MHLVVFHGVFDLLKKRYTYLIFVFTFWFQFVSLCIYPNQF